LEEKKEKERLEYEGYNTVQWLMAYGANQLAYLKWLYDLPDVKYLHEINLLNLWRRHKSPKILHTIITMRIRRDHARSPVLKQIFTRLIGDGEVPSYAV
jgi:hypothetical protein